MKQIITHWVSVLLMLFMAACNLPQSSASNPIVPISGGARTWFDAPLDGMSLHLEPYPVVIHSFDPGGVTQVEFSVNGTVLANLTPSTTEGLAQVEYSWKPEATGNFTLQARSQGQGGGWNSEAAIQVTIGEFTPTRVSSMTPTATVFTPTFTSTPTIHPTITQSPTPVPAMGLTFQANISANQICGNSQVTIQAYASDTNLVKGITIFLKLKDQASGASSSWTEGDAMNPAGNGWYMRTISPSSIPGYGDYQSSWILYQFVATGSGGSIIGRSQVYSDIAQSTCGAPSNGITPVRPLPKLVITPLRIVPFKTLIPSPK